MLPISGVNSYQGALGRVQLDAAYQAATVRMQRDAMQAVGEAALKLLDAAMAMDDSIGGRLNVTA